MLTVKPSATTMAAAALLLLLLVAAASSVESADQCSASVYRTCRFAVSHTGLAREKCCDDVDKQNCYCDIIRRIRADGLDEGAIWCLRGATCTQSSLRGPDDS